MPNPKVRTLTIGGVTYDLQDNISGYITGITSSDVTTALGFTPYNATNPNGYTNNTGTITSVETTAGAHTMINVSSGAANFNIPTKTSHLTNDSGFITEAVLFVTLTKSGSTYTSDKTYDEIASALANGETVMVNYDAYLYAYDGQNEGSYFFSGKLIESSKATQTDLTLSKVNSVTTWSESTVMLTPTDQKVQVGAITSGTTYYPILASRAQAATRQYDTTGLKYVGTDGTANGTNGDALLTLGNSTASTTANWKKGTVRLYGTTAYYTDLVSGAPSANRTIELPDKAGTIALISDIPTIPTTVSSFTNDAGYVTSSGVTSITLKAGSGISLDIDDTAITTTGTRTISHADTSSQASSSNSGRTYIQSITLDGYGHVTGISTATESVTNTDTKLQVAEVTSNEKYYPIVGSGTTAAMRQYDSTGFSYIGTSGTFSEIGWSSLILGNNKTSSSDGNKQGYLTLYGEESKASILKSGAINDNNEIILPDKSGTIALTSDIKSLTFAIDSTDTKKLNISYS